MFVRGHAAHHAVKDDQMGVASRKQSAFVSALFFFSSSKVYTETLVLDGEVVWLLSLFRIDFLQLSPAMLFSFLSTMILVLVKSPPPPFVFYWL